MKIYLPEGSLRDRTVYVQPGNERDDNAEWFARDAFGESSRNADGSKQPILFPVRFKDGMAEVPSHLGKYMVDKGMAQRTPIILPTLQSATDPLTIPEPKRTRRVYGPGGVVAA